MREAIVVHLKEQLRRGDKSLVGNKGYRRFLKVEGKYHFALDEEQIEADARYDGLWRYAKTEALMVEALSNFAMF